MSGLKKNKGGDTIKIKDGVNMIYLISRRECFNPNVGDVQPNMPFKVESKMAAKLLELPYMRPASVDEIEAGLKEKHGKDGLTTAALTKELANATKDPWDVVSNPPPWAIRIKQPKGKKSKED